MDGTPRDRATFSMPADTFMACFGSSVHRASFLMDAIKIHVPAGEGPVTFATMDSSHVCLMKAILQLGTRASRAFDLTLRCADVLKILVAVKATKPRTVAGSFSPAGFSIGGFTVNACHEHLQLVGDSIKSWRDRRRCRKR